MSFTVGGVTWTPKTASEHAVAMLNEYNALLQAQGLPQIVAVQDNALWLMMLAVGSKLQATDDAILQGYNSFNLDLADGQQISNLLPAAGTELIPGSATSVLLNIAAGSGGALTIPEGSLLPFGAVNFMTASGITIAASGTGEMVATCDTDGPIVIGPGSLTSFSASFPNLLSVTNPAAGVTGRNAETQNEARQRLIIGDTIGWNLNGVQRAISSIDGITQCRVYFNFSTSESLVLQGGTIILPRHAGIIIVGEDTSGTEIASTYFGLMNAPTDGLLSQDYTFLNGQVIPVNYFEAGEQNLWVKVFYDNDNETQSGFETAISDVVEAITFTIGQTVSSQTISEALTGFQYATILGAEVSTDGVTYSNKADIDGDSVPVVFAVVVVSG